MSRQLKHFYEFGPFRVDPSQRVLFREGKPVALPPKSFETLLALVERSGQLVEKSTLIEEVWPETFVEENNLAQYISALRKMLGDGRREQRYIETVPRRGYRFAADVREVWEESPGPAIDERTTGRPLVREESEEMTAEQAAREGVPVPASAPARRSGLKRAVLVVSILAVVLAGGAFWTGVETGTTESRESGSPFTGSIAVLPFGTLGTDDEPYLGLGMADALITRLGSLKQITVRPTSAVQKYAGADRDPVAVGRELGVDLVLDGRVQRSDDRIRVTVQLIRTRDGATAWSGTFDGRFQDVLAAQDSLSSRVAQALQLDLSVAERRQLTALDSESPEAYRAYMMGRHYWSRRTPEGHQKAREHFGRAIELDPGCALAYAGLAGTHLMAPSELTLEQKERLAIKAIEIDETLAEPHAILGFVNLFYRRNWRGAEQELKRAIELNPNYATAHQWYAIYLETQGRLDEAEMRMRRALEIDPLSLAINADLGELLYFRRDYDAALEQCLRTLDLDPTFAVTHEYLERIYTQKGMYAEAAEHFFKRIELARQPAYTDGRMASMRRAYARTGIRGLWRAHNDELEGDPQIDQYPSALYWALLGETDKALDRLEADGFHVVFIGVEPVFDRMRSNPRFVGLLERRGLAG
jgi:DNA-binding winged helix-turn-helix (wHTH) protein/TolB-like protein/lipoprotein NlpI